jgi:hypothetical protein
MEHGRLIGIIQQAAGYKAVPVPRKNNTASNTTGANSGMLRCCCTCLATGS